MAETRILITALAFVDLVIFWASLGEHLGAGAAD